jgi:hypothetical protein
MTSFTVAMSEISFSSFPHMLPPMESNELLARQHSDALYGQSLMICVVVIISVFLDVPETAHWDRHGNTYRPKKTIQRRSADRPVSLQVRPSL